MLALFSYLLTVSVGWFTDNDIGSDGAKYLAEALKSNDALVYLHVDGKCVCFQELQIVFSSTILDCGLFVLKQAAFWCFCGVAAVLFFFVICVLLLFCWLFCPVFSILC